jgi:hypothetical protein
MGGGGLRETKTGEREDRDPEAIRQGATGETQDDRTGVHNCQGKNRGGGLQGTKTGEREDRDVEATRQGATGETQDDRTGVQDCHGKNGELGTMRDKDRRARGLRSRGNSPGSD